MEQMGVKCVKSVVANIVTVAAFAAVAFHSPYASATTSEGLWEEFERRCFAPLKEAAEPDTTDLKSYMFPAADGFDKQERFYDLRIDFYVSVKKSSGLASCKLTFEGENIPGLIEGLASIVDHRMTERGFFERKLCDGQTHTFRGAFDSFERTSRGKVLRVAMAELHPTGMPSYITLLVGELNHPNLTWALCDD